MKLSLLVLVILFVSCKEDMLFEPRKESYKRVGEYGGTELVFTDPDTGCQYFTGKEYFEPRLTSQGVPMCRLSSNGE